MSSTRESALPPRGRAAAAGLRDLPERLPVLPHGLRLVRGGGPDGDRVRADAVSVLGHAPPAGARVSSSARGAALTHAVLALGSLVMIFPVLWMVSTSFKPPTEVLTWPPTLVPSSPTLQNYGTVFDTIPIVRFFFNSVFISTVSTALVV